MSQNKNFTAVFLLITLSLIWGTSFILIKQGLKVFAPDVVGALRVTAASLFLLPLALPRLKELKQGDSLQTFGLRTEWEFFFQLSYLPGRKPNSIARSQEFLIHYHPYGP
jgi:drug/metabolite transporter (DMT)-like permease